MIKKILYPFHLFLSRYLDIFAMLFLIMNAVIWYLNDSNMDVTKYRLFQQMSYVLLAIALTNFYRFDLKSFVKDNLFFLAIFALGLYNASSIIVDFNGYSIDMGLRSKELILEAFPTFLIILVSFRLVHKNAFIVGLISLLGLMVFYQSLAIGNKHFGLKVFEGITLVVSAGRHQAILNNPNVLGEYAFIGIYASFFIAMITKPFVLKIIALLPIPILGYGLILSGSRTALFMIIILYIMINVYLAYFRKASKIIILLGNLLLLSGIVLISLGFFSNYIEMIRDEISFSGRDTIWINTFKIINDNLIKGVGYNNFTFVYNELFYSVTSPHNMLLGITAELGILGLLLVIGWFIYSIVKNHNAIIKNKGKEENTYLILFNVFYITFFIGQMTEASFLKFSTIFPLFLMIQAFNQNIISEYGEEPNLLLNWFLMGVSFIALFIFFGSYLKSISDLYLYGILVTSLMVIIYDVVTSIERLFKDPLTD